MSSLVRAKESTSPEPDVSTFNTSVLVYPLPESHVFLSISIELVWLVILKLGFENKVSKSWTHLPDV